MSSTDRLNRLLLAEDWKRVYQSYKNADFKSCLLYTSDAADE